MAENHTEDAVSHFSGHAREFHAYYRDRPDFQERLDLWGRLLDKYRTPGGLSIDMGCGTGVFSFYLAEKGGTVVGIDGAPGMVTFCEEQRLQRGLANLSFKEGRLPLVDTSGLGEADLVISSSVVEYVPDLEASLALFSRLLKPGGALILSMPNLWCINRIVERARHAVTGAPHIYQHILHFTSPARLRTRMQRVRLALLEVHYYDHHTRLARMTRALQLPPALTEDLFVAVFRKQ